MIHYSCDLCGRDLAPGDEPRYIVRIEVFAAEEQSELTDNDLDTDSMESLQQLLNENGPDLSDQLPPMRRDFRYDLCTTCQARYLRNPMVRETNLQFSDN